MGTVETAWAISGVVAFLLLPVGAVRLVAYRSGEVDHTRALRSVAIVALSLGALALVVFLAMTIWLLATGTWTDLRA